MDSTLARASITKHTQFLLPGGEYFCGKPYAAGEDALINEFKV